ncbi:unnamed protein product [Victoria cruziana]
MRLVQVFDDGQRLRQQRVLVPQQRHQPCGRHRGIGLVQLLALEQVDRPVDIVQALQRQRDAHPPGGRGPEIVEELHGRIMPPASHYTAAHVATATACPPMTTASGPPAPPAPASITRTRSTSSARCRCGATGPTPRCCCASARSSRATACGRCRRDFWNWTDEEAGAQIELQNLYCLLNVVKVGQIHIYYRARLLSPEFDPGPETLEARLFHEHEVPWDELAFRTVPKRRHRASGRGGDAPDHIADIVGHQQRAAAVQRDAHRPSLRLALPVQKSTEHEQRRPRGPRPVEGHEDHLVAAARLAVPRAMLADEHALREARRQAVAARRRQAQRGGVRAQRIVGHQGPLDQIRPRRPDPLVHMRAEIAVGPAVEAAVAHRAHVVGHQVVAQFVALVDRHPQRAAVRLPGHADRIAQAAGVDALRAALRVDLQDGRAPLLGLQAVLGDIAVGADADVQLAAIGTGDQALGPVMVARAGRQLGHLGRRAFEPRQLGVVGPAQQRIGVGDVEVLADQGHAQWRVEAFGEDEALVGNAVAIGVAQQRDAVGAGTAGAGPLHEQAGDPGLEARDQAQPLARARRRLALGHQYIAIGQHMDPARMVELVCADQTPPRCAVAQGPVTPSSSQSHKACTSRPSTRPSA